MLRNLDLLGALALLCSLAYGYALPGACSGICNNAHDPSIIRRPDGTYFRFSTGGKIAVHTAPSISGPWTYRGAMLPSGSKINLAGNQDLWVSISCGIIISRMLTFPGPRRHQSRQRLLHILLCLNLRLPKLRHRPSPLLDHGP